MDKCLNQPCCHLPMVLRSAAELAACHDGPRQCSRPWQVAWLGSLLSVLLPKHSRMAPYKACGCEPGRSCSEPTPFLTSSTTGARVSLLLLPFSGLFLPPNLLLLESVASWQAAALKAVRLMASLQCVCGGKGGLQWFPHGVQR